MSRLGIYRRDGVNDEGALLHRRRWAGRHDARIFARARRQDVVATANLLASQLASNCPSEDELDAVRRRREFPVRMTQRMQVVAQNNIVSAALKPGNQPLKVPFVMRLITAVPWLQGITARFIGLGVHPEHVQSPATPDS